jgi:hypothetical protein
MARLGLLLFLLLNLLRPSDALAQSCYCTTQTNPVTGNCYANVECWACAPGAYDINWQQAYCTGYIPPAPTCQPSSVSEQRSCPANYSGFELWQKDTTCSNDQAVEGSWYKAGDTCAPNPPTCQVSSEAKVEACQAGYVGQKDYARQSVCPDPYGSAVWGSWNLVSDSCTKSVTNPTNPLSPISPVSPMAAPATPVAPVTAPAPAPMTTMETPLDSPADAPASSGSTSDSPTPSAAPSAASPAPASSAGSGARAAALVQRLTMIGALPPQPTIVETLTLIQELPNDIRRQQDFLVELIANDDHYRALGDDQRARFGGLLRSNPIQSGYDSD